MGMLNNPQQLYMCMKTYWDIIIDFNADSTKPINKPGHNFVKPSWVAICKQLPNSNAEKLIGVNIDSFHKNPVCQAQMFANLSSAYVATAPRRSYATSNRQPDHQREMRTPGCRVGMACRAKV